MVLDLFLSFFRAVSLSRKDGAAASRVGYAREKSAQIHVRAAIMPDPPSVRGLC
jgi:hypothetical protein